jgi:murein DD-endopeptidase MepM/ murein hydrolase activator NlpD
VPGGVVGTVPEWSIGGQPGPTAGDPDDGGDVVGTIPTPRVPGGVIRVAKPPDDAQAGRPDEWPDGGPAPGPSRGRMSPTDDRRLTLTYEFARRTNALLWPVAGGGTVTQRFHAGHGGLDIAAPWGTPIVAAADGVVVYRGWRDDRGGNEVWIKHGPNLYTLYAHLAGFAVRRGQFVRQGDVIAAMGSTGYSTGSHLHFTVAIAPMPDWDANQRDPLPLLAR